MAKAIAKGDCNQSEFEFADGDLAFVEWGMKLQSGSGEDREIRFLHELGERIAAADPLHTVLALAVDFVSAVVRCDSCFIYVAEGNELILRASKNPHADAVDRLKLRFGQGITGWVGEHKKPVAIAQGAMLDSRFQTFNELPEDRYEAFLSVPMMCRERLVGVINVQHCEAHAYTEREIRLVSTVGFLVGPEIEMARAESENARLAELPEARKVVEKAKEILQRDLGLDEEGSEAALRAHSQQHRKSLRQVAEAIILGDEIRRAHETHS